ncbi:hypothetical protein [Mycobacterium paraffinicum]|uniref:ESX secretion-associated protein EspG n=1 Tax=Mycobacterium paraffinicum TaxID=53378 RepID=A0ABP8F217_9MYCO|nr:hypothetical protein [Mycobacterium paraffinicum]MCV7311903.1 hypothetical protein [Mycobacterium paraffinicum]
MPDSSPEAETPKADPEERPWFARKNLLVWIYRVNRRPAGTLFDDAEPLPDVLDHLFQNLNAAPEVTTGRAHKREWRVGNVERNETDRSLRGRIGWSRSGEQLAIVWDAGARAWVDTVVADEASAAAPFWFEAERRYIGILKHPSFEPQVLSSVLEQMLNIAEARRTEDFPTVAWAVDAVGDTAGFRSWLERTDAVTSLEFVFERPNPDAEDEFRELLERMDRLKSQKISDRVVAQDPAVGIDKAGLLHDPVSLAFMAAAGAAFGYIVGRGRRGSRKVKFDQRRNLLTESVEAVGPTWDSAAEGVRAAVERALGRSKNG